MATCLLLHTVENLATVQATVLTRYLQVQLYMDLEYLLVPARFYVAVWEARLIPEVAHRTREDMVRMVPDLLR